MAACNEWKVKSSGKIIVKSESYLTRCFRSKAPGQKEGNDLTNYITISVLPQVEREKWHGHVWGCLSKCIVCFNFLNRENPIEETDEDYVIWHDNCKKVQDVGQK